MGIFKDIYDVGMDWIEARMPLKVSLSIRDDPPTIYVSITNRTRKFPVFINAVRIHYGQKDYSHSLWLQPYDKQQIDAKDTKDFRLIPVLPIRVARHQLTNKLPAPDSDSPSFGSPIDLFRAIANGSKNDSWIEMDFNEFTGKRFKKGEIKGLFAETLRKAASTAPKKDMLPPSIKGLMQEAVNNQVPVYHQSVNEAQRQLTFKMSRQGLLNSNVYRQERGKIYIAELEKFAKIVLVEIKRIHFIPYANCETDLIAIATEAIDTVYQHESKLFQKLHMHDQDFHWVGYKASFERLLRASGTEIKIYVNELWAKSRSAPRPTTQPITTIDNSNIVQSGQNQTFQQVENQKHEKPHWTVTPMFWITVIGLVVAAIAGFPSVWDWFFKHQQSSIGGTSNFSNSAFVTGNNNSVTVENSEKNYYGDTNHPSFKIYINDTENEFTNGSFNQLEDSRVIQLYVKNTSQIAVPDLTVEFVPTGIAATNLNLEGWSLHGEIISTWHYLNTNLPEQEYHAPEYVFYCGLTPPGLLMRLPPISIKQSFISKPRPKNTPQFYVPAMSGSFNVYATGSPLQVWSGNFYLKGQDFPSPQEIKQGYSEVLK